eukprot:2527612-Karenia_brevis.AAC.1
MGGYYRRQRLLRLKISSSRLEGSSPMQGRGLRALGRNLLRKWWGKTGMTHVWRLCIAWRCCLWMVGCRGISNVGMEVGILWVSERMTNP